MTDISPPQSFSLTHAQDIEFRMRAAGKWREDGMPNWDQMTEFLIAEEQLKVEVRHEANARAARARVQSGGRFTTGDSILDVPATPPAIWGSGSEVIWAEGESLMIAGLPGTGKSTLAGQFLPRRLGIDSTPLLGYPVARGRKVLYLAMDRPQQIKRALRRHFAEEDRDILEDLLVVWEGPPPQDVAREPGLLLEMAQHAGADTMVLDSMKDAAIGLSDDTVGAGYNRSRQTLLAGGIELCELHHLVKRNANGGKPTTLADVYGSAWLTAGAGSVVLLSGDAGDPIVDFIHLKQPAEPVGPFKVIHDHTAGRSEIFEQADVVALALRADGVTAKDAAVAMFDDEKPSVQQVEKARRKLARLVNSGHLEVIDPGDKGTRRPAVWRSKMSDLNITRNITHAFSPEGITDTSATSRDGAESPGLQGLGTSRATSRTSRTQDITIPTVSIRHRGSRVASGKDLQGEDSVTRSGPCATCGYLTERYGPGGTPHCSSCAVGGESS